jgi:SAM-dependent methyltransferase
MDSAQNVCQEAPPVTAQVAQAETETTTAAESTAIVCPACGHSAAATMARLQFESSRGQSPWAHCTECGAYHLIGDYNSANEAEHTAQMPWGQQVAGIELNNFKKPMFEAALAGIKRYAPDAKTLLDVGCSFGGFLLEARRHGYVGAGVDIVPEAVQYVCDQGLAAEQCSSLKDCRLYSEQDPVDVLTVLDAHIYWPDQPGELKAAWKLIRPGGLLAMRAITKSQFISVGRALSPVAPGFSKRLIRRAVTDHRFCMPLKSLLHTIEDSGFEIISVAPRDAQHSDGSSLAVRSLFAIGDLSWKLLGTNLAPGAMIFARKPAA